MPLLLLTILAVPPLPLEVERTNDLDLRRDGGDLVLRTKGVDPFIEFRHADIGATRPVLAFDYFAPDGVRGLEVYYGPPVTPERRFAAGSLTEAETWTPFAVDLSAGSGGAWTPQLNVVRLDLGSKAGVSLRLRDARMREPTEAERRSLADAERLRTGKQAEADRVAAYLTRDFPGSIDEVRWTEDETVISGQTPEAALLVRLPPSAATGLLSGLVELLEVGPGPFAVSTDAGEGISLRYALVRDGLPYSHTRYVTDFGGVPDLPEMRPRSLKGLGGLSHRGPRDDYERLGVAAVTVNVRLDRVATADGQPDERYLKGLDELVGWATRRGIVVSAILLVPQSTSARGRGLVHPESDGSGVYAMPDMTTPAGVAAYAAAVRALADRYCRPGDPHGRIVNWIVHNEVDRYRSWTDMGLQPRLKLSETYVRSMRLVHNIARTRDPHARVFISLTHHWDVEEDPLWRWHGSKAMLEDLAALSRAEGDFAWGVAYHPYPQSLWKPTPWADTQPTDDFDTPKITPENLAVLCRWMKTPAMRTASGAVRGVLLSEQGFHTPDDSEASHRTQAAALLYTFDRLKECDCVESFHYHRWIDAAGEGGLMLGLRTLPDAENPIGRPKTAWELFRDIGTPAESRWRHLETEWSP